MEMEDTMSEETREVSIKMHVYVEVDKELSEQEEETVVLTVTQHLESKGWMTQVHEHEQQKV